MRTMLLYLYFVVPSSIYLRLNVLCHEIEVKLTHIRSVENKVPLNYCLDDIFFRFG